MKKHLILTILALFAIPMSAILPINPIKIWYSQYIGVAFFLFLLCSLKIWEFRKSFGILFAYCIFSTFFVAQVSPRAIIMLMHLGFGLIIVEQISRYSKQQRKYVLWAIVALVALQGVWLLLQRLNVQVPIKFGKVTVDATFNSLSIPGKKELVAFMGNNNQLGAFFALTFPVILHTFWPLLVVSLIALFIAKASFSFVAVVASLLFYLWFKGKKIIITALILILVAGFGFFRYSEKLKPADFITRFSVWKHAISSTIKGKIIIGDAERTIEFSCNPLLGYGLGNFLIIFPYVPQRMVESRFNYVDEKFNHAHNDFIEFFFETGYIGLIILLWFLLDLAWLFVKTKKSNALILYASCLLAYFINANGIFLTQQAISGFLLVVFLGLYLGVVRENGTQTSMV